MRQQVALQAWRQLQAFPAHLLTGCGTVAVPGADFQGDLDQGGRKGINFKNTPHPH